MSAGNLKKLAFSVFLLSVASALVVVQAAAQGVGFNSSGFGATIHGVPPSVTSFGFGGSPGFHGVPPSVTSLNFGRSPFGVNPGGFGFRHHHRNSGFISPFFGDVVAVPYAYPVYVMEPGVDDSMEEEDYRGGPTIFDRRGPGTREYARPEHRAQQEEEEDYRVSSRSDPQKQQEVADQPRTVLVFKDGHELEIANYAIVGATLYDLSDGRTRKVALAELDLQATVKQNGAHGVDFELPTGSRLN
jgi:hypothetical protein